VKADTLLVVNENYLPVLLKLLDHAEKSMPSRSRTHKAAIDPRAREG
jgi:hypothetical protein